MKYTPLYLSALLVIYVVVLANHTSSLETSLALQHSQNEALQTKAEECALKASKLANTVDPRHYSESTTERVYENCLNE